MIAGLGFMNKCECGSEYRTAASSYDHERWCPAHPDHRMVRYIPVAAPCEKCKTLELELRLERIARMDAERKLRFYETHRRRR